MPCGTSGLEFGFGDHQIESSIRYVYLNRIAVLHLAQWPPDCCLGTLEANTRPSCSARP